MKFVIFSAVAAALLSASTVGAANLPRQTSLGAALTPSAQGLRVEAVKPGGSADRAGLQAGDILAAVNEAAVRTPDDVLAALRALSPKQSVKLALNRDGQALVLTARLQPRPIEAYASGRVTLGAITLGDMVLRTIAITPRSTPVRAILLFVPGYPCSSVEAPDPQSAPHALFDALVANGIAVFRVEKPNVGDSRGGPPCSDVDFSTEVAGFRAGLAEARTRVAPGTPLFIFGHSMGGVIAPLIAQDNDVTGIAVYGTIVRNWRDYTQDLLMTQPLYGEEPASEIEASAEALRPIIDALYLDKLSLAATATRYPAAAALLRARWGWDGDERLFGRSLRYWQQLTDLRLFAAWEATLANVLSLYGDADTAAIDARDQRLIVRIAQRRKNRTAAFVAFAQTDHAMTRPSGLPQPSETQDERAFNPMVAETVIRWIDETIAASKRASR